MPHFCNCSADEYICQECGKVKCSVDEPSRWITVKRINRQGNVCADCIQKEANDVERKLMNVHRQGGCAGNLTARYAELMTD